MKKALCLFLAFTICFSFIACDESNHEGEAKTPSGSSIMKGRNYEKVVEIFREKGFTNIRTEPIYDLIFGWLTKDGEVEDVSVDGDVNYSPDKWVPADTEVVIRYHTFPKDEEEIKPTEDSKETEKPTVETNPAQPTTPIEEFPITDPTLPEDYDCILITASDLSLSTKPDYAHIDTDIIILGNQESVTISITANAPNVTWDDLILIYDETLLDVVKHDPTTTGNRTSFKAYITGQKAGNAEFFICTEYDLLTQEDNVNGYLLDIKKLNSTDGRIVYTTQNGEKYHFSEKCAGENAIKTTYHDATSYDYEPCSKCAG